MANLLTHVRQAVWAALDADAALCAFMGAGRRYRLDAPGFDPRRIAPADCPCLIVQPSALPAGGASPVHERLDYTLAVRGLTYGGGVEAVERFFALTRDALLSGAIGLPVLRRRRLDATTFEGPLNAATPRGFWAFECRLILTLRIEANESLMIE